MIDEPTVFILGAGASIPYGFPSGKNLRKSICNDFCRRYKAYLKKTENSNNRATRLLDEAEKFVGRFSSSSNKSIDLFLSRNTEFLEVGKRAILLNILDAEQNSKFHENTKNSNLDWYSYLFDQMTDELIKPDNFHISKNKISFITFNYDRSLEHFLFNSFSNSFGEIELDSKIDEFKKIPVHHLYGKIADLEWQNPDEYLLYGQKTDEVYIDNFINNIQVIYENREQGKIESIIEIIMNAKHVYFLGFGYAKENLQLLSLPEILIPNQHINGTVFGYYEEEKTKLVQLFTKHKKLHNLKFINSDNLELLRKFL